MNKYVLAIIFLFVAVIGYAVSVDLNVSGASGTSGNVTIGSANSSTFNFYPSTFVVKDANYGVNFSTDTDGVPSILLVTPTGVTVGSGNLTSTGGNNTFGTSSFGGGDITISATQLVLRDNIETRYGADLDYSIGYNSVNDTLEFCDSHTVGAGLGRMFIDANAIVYISSTTTPHDGVGVATGSGDLYVRDSLQMGGGVALYSQTEAQLKAMSPAAAGMIYYDSTNLAVVVSTGTGVGAFGLITTGALPTGW